MPDRELGLPGWFWFALSLLAIVSALSRLGCLAWS